jgi:Flp pilus assembly pilin Flp
MSRRGQSTMEYAMFIAVVAAALISMTMYVRRSIQANFKMVERQINTEALR